MPHPHEEELPPGAADAVLPRYVSLCSRQLLVALEESRTEMDGITAAALSPDKEAAIELITRLQSVDRLMQRLSNVQLNLDRLAKFVTAETQIPRVSQWSEFMEQTRASFTMEQERALFDEMLSEYSKASSSSDDDITLF